MKKLIEEIRKYVVPGKYVIAFSGGSDSVALTFGCAQLQKSDDSYAFMAGHIEHGLRGEEAERDAEFAQTFCQQIGMDCKVVHVDVPSRIKLTGESIEDAARTLRYRALMNMSTSFCAKRILTAHHANDQAETILFRLVRGAGMRGLGAMHQDNGFVLRPLLGFTKIELEEICKRENLLWVEDSSNNDVEYSRNYIRKEVFPLLEKLNPNIVGNMCQCAKILQEDEDALSAWADKFAKKWIQGNELQTADWHLMPLAVRKRIIRSWLYRLGCEPSMTHTEAVDKLILTGTSNKELALPGLTVRYAYHKVHGERIVKHIRD